MRISRRALGVGLLLAPTGAAATSAPAAPWTPPSDEAIRRILTERLDLKRQGVGVVVGVIDQHGRRIVTHGVSARDEKARPLDGRTVFEIGSMTKVFTSLLLADMVRRGEVRLDDPVAKYLPAGIHLPERGGRQITLVDLATHTSGLPRMPTNFTPKDPANPYADYGEAQLFAYLNSCSLPRDIGVQYEYSNLGAGLLGVALAHRAGDTYEAVLRRRVLKPLGLRDTAITLDHSLQSRLAHGYAATLAPAANWDLDALAGAGALRSTTDDMLTFLAFELGFRRSRLSPAMTDEWTMVRRRAGVGNIDVALAWHVSKFNAGDVVWHNGGTGGYRTFFGFDPKAKVGAVVLTNAATPAGGDDIGFHILAGRPLLALPMLTVRGQSPLESTVLADVVGNYEFGPKVRMVVTQDGPRFYAQITGQPALEIRAEGANEFYWPMADARMTFQRTPDGMVAGVVVHQAGQDTPGTRVGP